MVRGKKEGRSSKRPMMSRSIDREVLIAACVCALVVLACVLPMGLSPVWNGEDPQWRDQYELLARSLLQGKLYLDLPVDPLLMEMADPYDPATREALGVSFYWDHAFYDGHYYMYFGIVPVLLVFLPYQLIVGAPLTTFHATQLFVALFVIGLFVLFWRLRKAFFPRMLFGIYLLLAVAFSAMSVWFSVGAPALYCTAISSAICMEVWSLCCFLVALLGSEERASRRRGLLVLGALLGALAFGCRPPVALANLIVVPLLFALFKDRAGSMERFVVDAVCVIAPYAIVGALLMLYNYVRFDSFFEFGQTYQLTVADQSGYAGGGSKSPGEVLTGLVEYFFTRGDQSPEFGGVFLNYPILVFAFVSLLSPAVRRRLQEERLVSFLVACVLAAFVIGLFDVLWSPFVLERYRMDVYWLLGVVAFVLLGFWAQVSSTRAPEVLTAVFASLALLSSAYFFLIPNDGNIASLHPRFAEALRKVLSFGVGD